MHYNTKMSTSHVTNKFSESIEDMMYRMSIHEARKWKQDMGVFNVHYYTLDKEKQDHKKDIAKCFHERTQPLRYLEEVFDEPKQLLECMLMNSVVISGSFASGFFDSASTTPESDVDFYAMPNFQGVYNFMQYMSARNVKWYTPLDTFIDIMQGEADSGQLLTSEIIYICKAWHDGQVQGSISTSVKALAHDFSGIENVSSVDDMSNDKRRRDASRELTYRDIPYQVEGVWKTKRITELGGNYNQYLVIRGMLRSARVQKKIQLIVPGDSELQNVIPMSTISMFDTSITQCAITGFGCFHMHYTELCNKQISVWNNQYVLGYERPERNGFCVKYNKRGYKFHNTNEASRTNATYMDTGCKRIMGDVHSLVLGYDHNMYSDPKIDNIVSSRLSWLYEYKWLQNQNMLSQGCFYDDIIGPNVTAHLRIRTDRIASIRLYTTTVAPKNFLRKYTSCCSDLEQVTE